MRRYETICIITPNANEDDITAIIDRTNGVIEQFGGSIIQIDRWGLKKLAYLIMKENQGYYVYSEYAGSPEAVDELERLFRIDEKVSSAGIGFATTDTIIRKHFEESLAADGYIKWIVGLFK